ncbi:gas vesicle protein GvpG [Metabacillus sp. RGM 3146]|uniref:gas vesicle protein GvpG n=1 Tax=Metabacillus sp. RGM 3146 TaxID=3401092 RepID=UPI003B9BB661
MIHKLFTAPINLVIKVGEKVQEEADKELYDLETIQRKLVHLELMLEMEEITEEEYKESEEVLLERYEIAKRKEQALFQNRD